MTHLIPAVLTLSLFAAVNSSIVAADDFHLPEFRLLWPDGAPEAKGDADADTPGVWVYSAKENANGAAIVICPGGGYAIHATDHEGVQPAKYFNSIGVTAFVLRYRLSPYRHPVPRWMLSVRCDLSEPTQTNSKSTNIESGSWASLQGGT